MGAYDRALGLSATTFDGGGAWGLTRSVVRDQIVLLRAVGWGAGPLTGRGRDFVRQLMANVEADQRWGVTADAPAGATVEVKNGQLSNASFGGTPLKMLYSSPCNKPFSPSDYQGSFGIYTHSAHVIARNASVMPHEN